MIKQCLIHFGPIVNEGQGQFSFQAGTAPSRATIKTRLSASYPQIGTLRITDGSASLSFPNCRVVRHTIRRSNGGLMREITIEDRRWVWANARIWGEYNSKDKGIRGPSDEKSARELAELCLQAMGERRFDVSALPDDAYPEVTWDAEEATVALERICSEFGCLVVLQPFADRVRVFKNNDGVRPRIDSRAMDQTPSAEPQVVPPLLIFEGGPTMWQADLPLEAVGIDKLQDKEVIRPIDKLTYKPAQGWEKENPKAFYGVDEEFRDLARRSVWRMFRIKPPIELNQPPHGIKTSGGSNDKTAEELTKFFTVEEDELWRLLPCDKQMIATAGLDADGERREAKLLGAFVNGKSVRKNNVDRDAKAWKDDPDEQLPDDDELVFQDRFSVDGSRGIVTTSRPCYYLENNNAVAPTLRLRTAFGLRHRETRAFVSQQYRFKPPSPTPGATFPELVKQADVFFEIMKNAPATPPDQAVTNARDFIAAAELYLAERLNALYPDEALTVPYKGFVFDFLVDGAVRSVTWATGPKGGHTTVDYAIERPEMRLTHKQLREDAEQLAAARWQVAAQKRIRKLMRDLKRGRI